MSGYWFRSFLSAFRGAVFPGTAFVAKAAPLGVAGLFWLLGFTNPSGVKLRYSLDDGPRLECSVGMALASVVTAGGFVFAVGWAAAHASRRRLELSLDPIIRYGARKTGDGGGAYLFSWFVTNRSNSLVERCLLTFIPPTNSVGIPMRHPGVDVPTTASGEDGPEFDLRPGAFAVASLLRCTSGDRPHITVAGVAFPIWGGVDVFQFTVRVCDAEGWPEVRHYHLRRGDGGPVVVEVSAPKS